jgi:DNA-binding MarR family transcriptional regulator
VQESPDRNSPTLQRYASHLLRRAFHRASQLSHVGLPHGLQPRDFTVLGVLAGQDVLSQQELAERLEINRTIVVKLIDKLAAAGYAVRTRNPADRRTYMLSVTDAGRQLLAEVDHTAVTGENEFLGSLTVRERRELNRLLRELVPEISQEVAGEQPSSYFITLAHHRLRRRGNELMAEHGLQARHTGALIALHDAGSISQQQLARIVGTTEATMVLVIDELEAAGAVKRKRNPADRRSNALVLTSEGTAMLGRAADVLDRVQSEVVHVLGVPGDERLRALLTKLLWGVPAQR